MTALILCHKQKASARTRFLRLRESVLALGSLSVPARLAAVPGTVRPDPVTVLRVAEAWLSLPPGSIEAVDDFQADVNTPDGIVPVILGSFGSIDPPFAAAEAVGARFVSIIDAAALPQIELDLLRLAYEVLIG